MDLGERSISNIIWLANNWYVHIFINYIYKKFGTREIYYNKNENKNSLLNRSLIRVRNLGNRAWPSSRNARWDLWSVALGGTRTSNRTRRKSKQCTIDQMATYSLNAVFSIIIINNTCCILISYCTHPFGVYSLYNEIEESIGPYGSLDYIKVKYKNSFLSRK